MDIFQRIFNVIFLAMILVPALVAACPGCSCEQHTYTIGTKTFTWPAGPSNDVWIGSNCRDRKELLIFRKCLDGSWTPGDTLFQITCQYENLEHLNDDCPKNFQSIQLQGSNPKTICVLKKGIQYDFITDLGVCIQDNIFTLQLNLNEQTQLIERLSTKEEFQNFNGLIALGARWRYPCKLISYYFDHKKEDIELHDVRCGRFGLQLNLNLPFICTEQQLICQDLCLYLNVTTEPYFQVIDKCNESVIAKPKNSFLHEINCPKGYYRTEYDYVAAGEHNVCYSIQMFSQPISVEDVINANVIQTYCNGTIMAMNWGDDVFVFRELADRIGLSEGNHCLFGLTSNRISTYSDWNSSSTPQTPFLFNWDKEMNYSQITAPDTVSYLTVKPNGLWTWAIDSVSCIVCMVRSSIPIPELQLTYNIFERLLVLTVTNQNYLYKEKSSDPGFICHYDHNDVHQSNLTISRMTYASYLIEDVGEGSYWCSGHNVIDRRYIWNGKRMLAYEVRFVFEVVRKCANNCSFSPDDRDRFNSFFKSNSGPVGLSDSIISEHETAESEREYTFTAYLSLTLSSYLLSRDLVIHLTEQERKCFLIYEELHKAIKYEESGEMNIKSFKSSQYCLHNVASSIEAIIWRVALIGETISTSPLCPSEGHGTKITRTCSGDSVNGSFWDQRVNITDCHTFVSQSLLELYENFTAPGLTNATLESLKDLLLKNTHTLLPLDVFLTSRILQKVSRVTFDNLQNMFSIYSTIMQIDEGYLKMAASLNSTNILLETLDNSLSLYVQSAIIGNTDYQNFGISYIRSSFIETYILDPVVSGTSGIALYRPRNSTAVNGFSFYSSRYIYPNQSIHDLMTEEEEITDKDWVVGLYLPINILQLHENITIVVTIFFNDTLFQTTEDKVIVKIYGHVVSLKVLGLTDKSILPHKIPIFFQSNGTDDASICGHWSSGSINEWSSSVCNVKQVFVKNDHLLAVCECSLFGHFGYLVKSSIDEVEEELVESRDNKQTIFTVVATSFSFFGTLVVILTAVVSQKWRNKVNSKILVHFSVAISLETFLVIAMNFDEQILTAITSSSSACVAFGSMLHYSVLAMTFWMLIFAYFHFKSFIAVLNFEVSHLRLKSIIFGWIAPLLPVLIVLVVDYTSYVPISKEELKFCYPTGFAMYLGVVAPTTLICLTNLIILMSVLISLVKRANSSTSDGTEFKLTLSQVFVSAFLFIDLSLAGIFALLSKIFPNSLFLYIFYVTALLQGPALLLNFIAFDISLLLEFVHSFV